MTSHRVDYQGLIQLGGVMYSRLSRSTTARGSGTGFYLVGPARVFLSNHIVHLTKDLFIIKSQA